MKLHLDFETASEKDVSVDGLDVYATHPSTKIALTAYAFGDGPVKQWQAYAQPMPEDLRQALYDPSVEVWAWNCEFERVIMKWVLDIEIDISRCRCAMAQARYLSLPGSLEECGKILGLAADEKKIHEGRKLIKMFCFPAKLGGTETLFGIEETFFRNQDTHPREWEAFCGYNKQDVVAERAILNRMSNFLIPDREWDTYAIDQAVNDRGVYIDLPLVKGAVGLSKTIKSELTQHLFDLTKLENPNSRDQMLGWCRQNGYPYHGLGKNFVNQALAGTEINKECREALITRQQAAKTSDTKFDAILTRVGSDDRLRYSYSYMGAARTHRWSAHGVQPQNLLRPIKEVNDILPIALYITRKGDYDLLKRNFKAEPLDVIGSCIRSSFIARPGHKLVICDLSAIENRVLGYICKAPSILKVFEENLDPYKYFAVDLYHKDYKDITKDERQNSKPPVLGCLGAKTLVLTSKGWKKIINIRSDDLVYDGLTFVSHSGLIHKGLKKTINLYGVDITPDHLVLTRNGDWIEAKDVDNQATKLSVKPTYDLLNAGPRNRFMIITNNGPLIVHNCGYGLSGGEQKTSEEGDIIYTGLMKYARSMNIPLEKELADKSVEVFREKHHEVVKCWWDLDNAAMDCIRTRKPQIVNDIICFEYIDDVLRATLPSGRSLHYLQPRIVDRPWYDGKTKKTIEYWGMNQEKHVFGRVFIYGSKFLENFDQSISRDLLVHGMKLITKMGGHIVLHTHDELVLEEPINSPIGIKELRDCMVTKPAWGNSQLILDAAGFESDIYRKEQ